MSPAFNPTVYANHPIQIPPEFPKILKLYTKAAIKTQPNDLLLWSACYFRCMANGEVPPVKERLEYPPPKSSGLSPGLLRILQKQLGDRGNRTITRSALESKWRGICLPMKLLEEIINSAGEALIEDEGIIWQDFLVEASLTISSNVDQTMVTLCEVLSDHPDGITTSSLVDMKFLNLLGKVCRRRGINESRIKEVDSYLKPIGKKQSNTLSPQNLRAPDCPVID